MATIRESLKKLVEVAKPVPGDEQEFVAKHGMKIMDFQGKDSLSAESPYDHILKNVAAVKAPPHVGEDHGHEAPGESERAYHIPESRDAKIAKLSEMMGKDEDEDEEDEEEKEDEEEDEDEDEDEKDETEMKEAKDVVGVKMHYHNPKTGEKFHEVHFTVPAAEKFRKQHEKAGFRLVKKEAQMAEAVEQVDELKKSTLASYINKAAQQVRAKTGIASSFETQGARKKDPANKAAYANLARDYRQGAKKRLTGIEKATARLAKEEIEQVGEAVTNYNPPSQGGTRSELLSRLKQTKDPKHAEAARKAGATQDELKLAMKEEMKPLLPKQKAVAADLLKKELERRKQERLAAKQAGTLREEDQREANDRDREERVATPRPTTPATIEGMRYRLQAVKKQIIDKT